VAGELESLWESGSPDPLVVPHTWVFRHEGCPVGFAVGETSLRRAIFVQHYVGMDQGVPLPLRWLLHTVDAFRDVAAGDCAGAGLELLGQMGEHHVEHVRAWQRFGYVPLDIDYQEPNHGKEWPAYGEPTFFPMVAMLRLTDEGRRVGTHVVAAEAVRAFAVDHYGLPEDHPVVARMLARAAVLVAAV